MSDMKVKTVADAVDFYKGFISRELGDHIFSSIQSGKFAVMNYSFVEEQEALNHWMPVCTRQEFEDHVKQQENKHDKNTAAIATLKSLGYEHNGGELWRPPLKVKPVYTQEMADNGELPPVGSDCMIKLDHEDSSHFNKGYIIGLSKCNEWLVFSDYLDNINQHNIKNGVYRFKPIDNRTDKEKLIDKAKELCKNLDKEDFDNLFNVYLK